MCKSDMLTISASTQRYYRRKAEQVVDVVLDAIGPGNYMWLFEQVRSRRENIQEVSSGGESLLISLNIVADHFANILAEFGGQAITAPVF